MGRKRSCKSPAELAKRVIRLTQRTLDTGRFEVRKTHADGPRPEELGPLGTLKHLSCAPSKRSITCACVALPCCCPAAADVEPTLCGAADKSCADAFCCGLCVCFVLPSACFLGDIGDRSPADVMSVPGCTNGQRCGGLRQTSGEQRAWL